MKITILVFSIILCMISTSAVLAAGYRHGYYGGKYHGYQGYHGGSPHWYHGKSGYRDYHGYDDDYDDLGVALAVIGGLILVSALIDSANSQPKEVVYRTPYGSSRSYGNAGNSRNSGFCFEDRKVRGELQFDSNSGQMIWVKFPYPLTRRVRVSCY